MKNVLVPDHLTAYPRLGHGDISFIHYRDTRSAGKNLISFSTCAISFILSGEKEMYRSGDRVLVRPGEGVVIPRGHSIIAERSLDSDYYSSLVAFFPLELAQDLIRKHKGKIGSPSKSPPADPDLLKFQKTPLLLEFAHHVLNLIEKGIAVSDTFLHLKLEELLVLVLEIHPDLLSGLISPGQSDLKMIVESNLMQGLTLVELAFLSNRSLATFKRDFGKMYGTSPGKYILDRKLEIAAHALLEGKRSVDLFAELSYENLSNFNTAFKRKFNQTPVAYQAAWTG